MTVPAPAPVEPTWWRRYRLWLALLAPLLALALAAASFRLVTIYGPWGEDHYVDHVAREQPYHFEQDYDLDRDWRFHRRVEVSLGEVRVVDKVEETGNQAVPGGVLHRVSVWLAADPSVPNMSGCTIQLVGPDNTVYDGAGGKTSRGGYGSDWRCVPFGQEGPTADAWDHVMKESDEPRPASWEAFAFISLPPGVRPVAVRIWWHRPDAVLLPLR